MIGSVSGINISKYRCFSTAKALGGGGSEYKASVVSTVYSQPLQGARTMSRPQSKGDMVKMDTAVADFTNAVDDEVDDSLDCPPDFRYLKFTYLYYFE